MPVVLVLALGGGVHVLTEELVPQPEGVLTETVRWEALDGRRRLRVRQLRCWEEVEGVNVFLEKKKLGTFFKSNTEACVLMISTVQSPVSDLFRIFMICLKGAHCILAGCSSFATK